MEEEFKEYLEDVKQVTEIMFEENFQLSDIGLSSKIAFDWSNAGIYLRERKGKSRRRYNGVEYVWLRLVKELREFGLSIQSILNLKDYLLSEMDLTEHYISLFETKVGKSTIWDEFFIGIQETFKTPENFISVVKKENEKINLSNTKLSVLLFSTILSKGNVHLAIAKDGNCIVFDENPVRDLFTSSMIMNQSYISIPLNHIVSDFMGREELYDLNLESGIDLNEAEKKIIDLVREGGINSLSIKFLDGVVNLIETEESIDVKETKGRLIDLIKKGSYQEISYKTVKGKIVSVKRRTKHK